MSHIPTFHINDKVIISNIFSPYKYTIGTLIALNDQHCGIETDVGEIIILENNEISHVASAEIKLRHIDMLRCAHYGHTIPIRFDDGSLMQIAFAIDKRIPLKHKPAPCYKLVTYLTNGNTPVMCLKKESNGWHLFSNFRGKIYILKIETIK